MLSQILSHERFETIRRILERRGPISARDLQRRHNVLHWELERAASLGLIEFENRKPRTGRPALIVSLAGNVNKNNPTKPLPEEVTLPRRLSIRHERFVLSLALATPKVRAYYKAGYRPRCYAAARAGASRLARRHDVQAALRYIQKTSRYFCRFPEDIASFSGIPWLLILAALPDDPGPELRCRLAAASSFLEARDFIKPFLETPRGHHLDASLRYYGRIMGRPHE